MMAEGRRGVHYPEREYTVHNVPRHKKPGVSWNGKYGKSAEGICTIFCIIVSMLTFLIIGFTPYTNPIFVLERQTWPFHLVMFFAVISWMLFCAAYAFFIMSWDEKYPNVPWVARKMQFYIAMAALALSALLIEATNIWRWDFSGQHGMQGNMAMGMGMNSMSMGMNGGMGRMQNIGGMGGYRGGGGRTSMGGWGAGRFGGMGMAGMGVRPGSMNANMGMQSYCARYPRRCNDIMSLMAGVNPYFGNHLFGCVLLVLLLIGALVVAVRSIQEFRKEKKEESFYDVSGKQSENLMDRVKNRFSSFGNTISTRGVEMKERISKVVKKDQDLNENDIDLGNPGDEEYGFKAADELQSLNNPVEMDVIEKSPLPPGNDSPPPGYPDSVTKSHHSSKSYNSRSDRTYAKSTSSSRSHRSRRRSRERDYDEEDRRSRRSSRGSRHPNSRESRSGGGSRTSSRNRERHERRRSRHVEEEEEKQILPPEDDNVFITESSPPPPAGVVENGGTHLPVASMMV